MKRVYPLFVTFCIVVTVAFPGMTFAQCTCAGGVPSTPVTQLVKVDTSNNSSATVTFQQYNDPTGGSQALTCVTLSDTITAVTSTGVMNTAGAMTSKFTSFVNYTVTGPGSYSTSNGNSLNYGPYTFGAAGTPTDSITLGPDTILNRLTDASTPSSVVPYIGTGTVNFSLIFGGGTIATGGLNFNYTVRTKYWGWFLLTYYWCPNSVLATSIQDFTAVPNGNTILLKWLTNNEQNNIQYEIQASTNGQSFANIGDITSNPASAGSTAKYQYQYDLNQTAVGTIYFRIKETDASGKVSYSAILIINPDGSADAGPVTYQTYPNPATNNLTLQFNQNLTGRYLLELVSTAGQVVLYKSVTMSGTSQISLGLNPQPAKGLYFLRTTDQTHGKSYVSKVFVQ